MSEADPEVNRGYLEHLRSWSRGGSNWSWQVLKNRILYGTPACLLFLPLLPVVALIVFVRLRFAVARQTAPLTPLHMAAIDCIPEFIEQYPLHLYPVVAKAFELAYLREKLPSLVGPESKIAEIGIGDGTLSARVFPATHRVTGLDLNPYSLTKALVMPHVQSGIVCDGLNPPLNPGAFDLLLANNFLHHVTQKRTTLEHWSRLATTLIFNEDTPTWASGWTVPYLLRKVGLTAIAARQASKIELLSMQYLEPVINVLSHVRASCRSAAHDSFFAERSFFYCSLFSFALRTFGPPTPWLWKRIALGSVRGVALSATRAIAELVIRFDAGQPRSTDAYVMFVCDTGVECSPSKDGDLCCAECRAALDSHDRCSRCGKRYERHDGMLFLLPDSLSEVLTSYRSAVADSIPAEHL